MSMGALGKVDDGTGVVIMEGLGEFLKLGFVEDLLEAIVKRLIALYQNKFKNSRSKK